MGNSAEFSVCVLHLSCYQSLHATSSHRELRHCETVVGETTTIIIVIIIIIIVIVVVYFF